MSKFKSCPGLSEGEALKAAALARFEELRAEHLLLARRDFAKALLARGVASADDISHETRRLPAEVDPKLFGATPVLFAKRKWIEKAGLMQTNRATAHARDLMQWRLIDRGAVQAWLDGNKHGEVGAACPIPPKQPSPKPSPDAEPRPTPKRPKTQASLFDNERQLPPGH